MSFTLETAGKNVMANALAAAAKFVTIHSANPAGTGANQTSTGRVAVTLTNSSGTVSISGQAAASGAAGAGATYAAFWDAATAGNMLGSGSLTGDTTFNAGGEYDLTGVSITVG